MERGGEKGGARKREETTFPPFIIDERGGGQPVIAQKEGRRGEENPQQSQTQQPVVRLSAFVQWRKGLCWGRGIRREPLGKTVHLQYSTVHAARKVHSRYGGADGTITVISTSFQPLSRSAESHAPLVRTRSEEKSCSSSRQRHFPPS